MEISEILRKAYDEVEESNIPEEYRIKAFEKSIDLIVGHKGETIKSVATNSSSDGSNQAGDTSSSVIGSISSELDIPTVVLEEVYYMDEDNDQLKIIIGSSKLEDSIAGATKEIALLIAGARQLGGIEDWTSTDLIRQECEYFNKYDSTNFAKTIKRMDDVFSFIGSGQSRKVKINRPGLEKLAELINSITGEND